MFGTPRAPQVKGIEAEQVAKLGLAGETLEKGSMHYRLHCLHCHGVTGNGRGPTAHWVNPHPRDYRQGLFKFQSVNQAAAEGRTLKPLRADLVNTLRVGIEGTAMPSFGLLPPEELEALASYVIHLSIRGEAEFATIQAIFNEDKDEPVVPADYLLKFTKKLGKDWADSQDKVIVPEPYSYEEKDLKMSVQRGQALFLADENKLKEHFPGADMNMLKGASCVSCHKDYGRQATFKFDSWGTLVRPADLTRSVYRGGRRPVDFYFRIHSGINGSGMANFGNNLDIQKLYPQKKAQELPKINPIWDLVNFVRVLPYPAMRESFGVEIN